MRDAESQQPHDHQGRVPQSNIRPSNQEYTEEQYAILRQAASILRVAVEDLPGASRNSYTSFHNQSLIQPPNISFTEPRFEQFDSNESTIPSKFSYPNEIYDQQATTSQIFETIRLQEPSQETSDPVSGDLFDLILHIPHDQNFHSTASEDRSTLGSGAVLSNFRDRNEASEEFLYPSNSASTFILTPTSSEEPSDTNKVAQLRPTLVASAPEISGLLTAVHHGPCSKVWHLPKTVSHGCVAAIPPTLRQVSH